MDSTHPPQDERRRYNPAAFDALTGVLLILWLTRLVPDLFIMPVMAFSVAASALLRLVYRREDKRL